MGIIMALDYGGKRTGIAVTDPLKIIASGLTTVDTKDLLDFISKFHQKDPLEALVVGLPKRLHDEASEIETQIQAFLHKFKVAYPEMPVYRVDERFTSKIAQQAMLQGGLKKKQRQDKRKLDEISATIILQSFLQQQG